MKEQQLNDLSIFALRELARMVGVASPTSKRKDDLIKEITAIKEGKQQPVLMSTRQGRPPKNSVINLETIIQDDKLLTLKQNSDNEDGEKSLMCGYVEKLGNNVGFLWVKENEKFKNYFMPMSTFEEEVRSGDFVNAETLSNNDGVVVKKVLTVNGENVSKLKNRTNYEELEHIFAENLIAQTNENYKNLNINFGQNIYIYGANNNQSSHLIELLNSCVADTKIYVNFAVVEKNKAYLKNLNNVEIFTTNMVDDLEYVKHIINISVERVKRCLENGKNVVVAIDDVLTVASMDFYLLKTLMSLTKNTENGSITIIAGMSNNECVNIFERLADVRLNATKENLIEF